MSSSYQDQIKKRLYPLFVTVKSTPVVNLFDLLVKVTVTGDYDEQEVKRLLEQAPFGPRFAKVRAFHGQVINVSLTTLPPADAAPVPVTAQPNRLPLSLTG